MQDILAIYNFFIVFQKEMLIANNNITAEIYHDLSSIKEAKLNEI